MASKGDARGFLMGLVDRFRVGAASLSRHREARLAALGKMAETEEERNRLLEERLEFHKQEGAMIERVQTARTTRLRLLESLDGYKRRGGMTWKVWLVVIVVVILLLIVLGKC